jgi:hypothetical protein
MKKGSEEMARQAGGGQVEAISDLLNSGLPLDLVKTDQEYNELADNFKVCFVEDLTNSGQIAKVDQYFIDSIRDNYRQMIALRDRIGGEYTERDKFGVDKPHHLMAEYRQCCKQFRDDLKQCGATPASREFKGDGLPAKAPHGNSKASKALDLLNGD